MLILRNAIFRGTGSVGLQQLPGGKLQNDPVPQLWIRKFT